MQVDDASSIKVGHWVRIYARAPSPAQRHLLSSTKARPALASTYTVTTLLKNRSAVHEPNDTLPLTPGLEVMLQLAQENALAEATSEGAVVAAQATDGTLDAYLYGNNMLDSGTSERCHVLAHICTQSHCLLFS